MFSSNVSSKCSLTYIYMYMIISLLAKPFHSNYILGVPMRPDDYYVIVEVYHQYPECFIWIIQTGRNSSLRSSKQLLDVFSLFHRLLFKQYRIKNIWLPPGIKPRTNPAQCWKEWKQHTQNKSLLTRTRRTSHIIFYVSISQPFTPHAAAIFHHSHRATRNSIFNHSILYVCPGFVNALRKIWTSILGNTNDLCILFSNNNFVSFWRLWSIYDFGGPPAVVPYNTGNCSSYSSCCN